MIPFPRVRSVPIRSDPPVRRVLLRVLAYTATVILAVVGLLPLLAITGVLAMIGDMSAWAAHDRPVLAALAALLVLAVAAMGFAVRRRRRGRRRSSASRYPSMVVRRYRTPDVDLAEPGRSPTPGDPPGDVPGWTDRWPETTCGPRS